MWSFVFFYIWLVCLLKLAKDSYTLLSFIDQFIDEATLNQQILASDIYLISMVINKYLAELTGNQFEALLYHHAEQVIYLHLRGLE